MSISYSCSLISFTELDSESLARSWPFSRFPFSSFVFADDFTTLKVEVVDDDVVPFSDLKPHPIRAPEKVTDNKTSEQTRITILLFS